MLPHSSGKVEEFENWRFLMVQFLSEEPCFVDLLEWIEHELYSEDQHVLAVQEKEHPT